MKRIIILWLLFLFILVGTIYIIYNFYNSNQSSEGTKINERTYIEVTPKSFDDVSYYIKNESKAMIIIGKNNCQFCNMYLPLIREASKSYGFEYMYVDISNFSNEDYKALMHSDIKIPSKCSDTGVEKDLNEGFGTPLTLFYNKGIIYDCIRGYVDKKEINQRLMSAQIID